MTLSVIPTFLAD